MSFFMFYWADKYLILRSYRKPPLFDNSLALTLLHWFKYALLGHFIFAISMYANTDIFTHNKQKVEIYGIKYELTPLSYYSGAVTIMIIIWIVDKIIITCFGKLCNCEDAFPTQKMNNFFRKCSFTTLRDELGDTEEALVQAEMHLESKPVETQQDLIEESTRYIKE